jgi:hypothetical protein
MPVSAASRTNEKLYQARQLLQLPASNDSARRSLQNGVLNAAIFSLHGAYLAFLLEIALAHRIKLGFVESLQQLAPLLEKKGVVDLAVRELQRLHAEDEWPAWLFRWYRAALGDDGWTPPSDKPPTERPHGGNNIIGIVDVSTGKVPEPSAAVVLDVLEKLRIFIEVQREHLHEW